MKREIEKREYPKKPVATYLDHHSRQQRTIVHCVILTPSHINGPSQFKSTKVDGLKNTLCPYIDSFKVVTSQGNNAPPMDHRQLNTNQTQGQRASLQVIGQRVPKDPQSNIDYCHCSLFPTRI